MARKYSRVDIEQRRIAPLKHGAGGAELMLTSGADFTGVAREAELAVHSEIETTSIEEVFRKRAARLQACADLYWGAILGAQGMEKLDNYVKRWGWIQASALRALDRVREFERSADRLDVTDMLRSDNGED